MKIELSEVENLKEENKSKSQKIIELETKLKELSESELKESAVKLSFILFENYMSCVFRHLGFESFRESVIVKDDLRHWLGKSWWNSEKINIQIGANITNQFKNAFLSIGILTSENKTANNDDYVLP
jgi:hypothetical protein